MDSSSQRCAGCVAEELEEGHEQSELAVEDFNDEVLLGKARKTTDGGRDVSVRTGSVWELFDMPPGREYPDVTTTRPDISSRSVNIFIRASTIVR